MFWYLLNVLLIIIFWMLPVASRAGAVLNAEQTERIRAKRTCFVAAVNWVMLSGLRAVTVGTDTEAYSISFSNSSGVSWHTLFERFSNKYFKGIDIGYKDAGFSIIEKLFGDIVGSYTVWLIFIAVIFTVPMAIYIYKYSKNACVSWIVYSTLFYSFFAITGHRQTIATAIVVWGGLELIRKRKLIPFLLLVAIGYTIHASVICLIPFYWLSRIKITRLILAGYLAAIAASFIFRNQLFSFLQSIAGYESYQQYEGAAAGMFMFLLIVMVIYVFAFWESISSSANPLLNMSVNALMIAAFFSSLLLINPSTMRVVQYYSIFILFIIPDFAAPFDKKSKKYFLVIISGIMIFLLVLNKPQYSFFFM